MQTVRRTRPPSVARFALSFVPVVLLVALERVVHVGWLAWVILIAVAFPSAWRDRKRKQAITASPAGLRLDDELVPRSSIVNALSTTDQQDQTWLRVELRDGATIEITAASPSVAHDLVRVLALDESKTALEIRLLKTRARGAYVGASILLGVALLYLAAVYMQHHFGTMVYAVILAGLAWSVVDPQIRRLGVVAGIDGIAITDRRGKTQFISWAEIESVGADGHDVILRRKSGDDVWLDALAGYNRALSSARAFAIAVRLESLRRAWAETPEPAKVLGLGQGAFRQSQAPHDVLWDALANPKTRVSDRVVAAAALRQNAEDADVARLRVAVDRYATPARERVRAVLDAEDENLERVVDEMARE